MIMAAQMKAIAHLSPGNRKNKKAQSMLEYALVLIAICLALLAMQAYLSRGMQGKIKTIADDLGTQYNYNNTTSDINFTYSSNTTTESTTYEAEEKDDAGKVTGKHDEIITNTTIHNETQVRQGTETVGL